MNDLKLMVRKRLRIGCCVIRTGGPRAKYGVKSYPFWKVLVWNVKSIIEHLGPQGECDVYLPRRRTIIETKRVGLADRPEEPQPREKNPESPKQQLERYLRSESAYEAQSLGLEGESEREWIGIVTDGRVWHVWRYPHGDLFKSTLGCGSPPAKNG